MRNIISKFFKDLVSTTGQKITFDHKTQGAGRLLTNTFIFIHWEILKNSVV